MIYLLSSIGAKYIFLLYLIAIYELLIKGVINIKLSGTKLAGSNSSLGRVDNDYYATDPKAVKQLFNTFAINKRINSFLEPCVGGGNIANKVIGILKPNTTKFIDIVDRGYPNTEVADYLTYSSDEKFDLIMTNPPYSLGQEFVNKSMSMLNKDGYLIMFLKIQFLEGMKRKSMFNKYPPKYIYVFRKRMGTWRNGEEFDEDGKHRSTTMCHAWFVWQDGFSGEPIVRWID